MAFGISDELLCIFVPIIVYWLYSGFYVMLGHLEKYRLHPKGEEELKNVATRTMVLKGVLLQQALQIAVSLLWFMFTGDNNGKIRPQPSIFIIVAQFMIAMFVMDTWQYIMHRYMHINKFLYKHVHSKHHLLIVPYAYGAMYSHPVEGLVVDTIGNILSFLAADMTPLTAVFYFSFATIKTVDDHCGLLLPGNVLHAIFRNSSAYHDVHHQLYGNKFNFAGPYFVTWDKLFGTHMDYTIESRAGGGFEARPVVKTD